MRDLCEKCDLVTGPGNIYVAAAKRALRGIIAIDSEAGPTEIAILADESAIAADVAADLISQAEHDVIAAAVLVTTSTQLAEDVEVELKKRVTATKHSERIRTALSGIQSAIVLVDSVEQGLDVVNAYAAEHLEIHTRDAVKDAENIRNAGAVFIGRFSRYHWAITLQAQTTFYLQVAALATAAASLFKLSFVDCTLLSMTRKHLQRSSIPL
jgi:histidinol dehydrogenase